MKKLITTLSIFGIIAFMLPIQGATVLFAPQGGTGISSYTRGDLIFASTTKQLQKLPVGSNGYVLTSNGDTPIWLENEPGSNWQFFSSDTITPTSSVNVLIPDNKKVYFRDTASFIHSSSTNELTLNAPDIDFYSGNTRVLNIDNLGITAYTGINAGVNQIVAGTGNFGSVLVDYLYLDDNTVSSIGVDLNIDNGGSTYFKASGATKASTESTGFHVGIHGGGSSTYVPLYLYDNYDHGLKFQTVKMATSLGYTINYPDPGYASEDFYSALTNQSDTITNGVPFFYEDNVLMSDAGLTYDKASQKFTVGTSAIQGSLGLVNSTRTTFLNAPSVNQTITLPTVPVATQAMQITSSGAMQTIANTGSGSNVLASSPALTTPSVTTSILLTRTALGSTPNYGFYARNTTASTALAPVQFSPAVQFFGTGWDSDGSASVGLTGQIYLSTLTGIDVKSQLRFDMDQSGGGSDTVAWLANTGELGLDGASNPSAKLSIGGNGISGTGLYVGGTDYSYKQALISDGEGEELFGVSNLISDGSYSLGLGDYTGAYGYAFMNISSSTIAFTSDKMGFFGATAVVKPSALTTGLTQITHTEPGTPDYAIQNMTNASPYGFVTQDEANSVLKVIKNLQARVDELEDKLQLLGLLN